MTSHGTNFACSSAPLAVFGKIDCENLKSPRTGDIGKVFSLFLIPAFAVNIQPDSVRPLPVKHRGDFINKKMLRNHSSPPFLLRPRFFYTYFI